MHWGNETSQEVFEKGEEAIELDRVHGYIWLKSGNHGMLFANCDLIYHNQIIYFPHNFWPGDEIVVQ